MSKSTKEDKALELWRELFESDDFYPISYRDYCNFCGEEIYEGYEVTGKHKSNCIYIRAKKLVGEI